MQLLTNLWDYTSVLLLIASFLMVPVAIFRISTAFESNSNSDDAEDSPQPLPLPRQ